LTYRMRGHRDLGVDRGDRDANIGPESVEYVTNESLQRATATAQSNKTRDSALTSRVMLLLDNSLLLPLPAHCSFIHIYTPIAILTPVLWYTAHVTHWFSPGFHMSGQEIARSLFEKVTDKSQYSSRCSSSVRWERLDIVNRVDPGSSLEFPNPESALRTGGAHYVVIGRDVPGLRGLRLERRTSFDLEKCVEQAAFMHRQHAKRGGLLERLEMRDDKRWQTYVMLLSECVQSPAVPYPELLCTTFFYVVGKVWIVEAFLRMDRGVETEEAGAILVRILRSFQG